MSSTMEQLCVRALGLDQPGLYTAEQSAALSKNALCLLDPSPSLTDCARLGKTARRQPPFRVDDLIKIDRQEFLEKCVAATKRDSTAPE